MPILSDNRKRRLSKSMAVVVVVTAMFFGSLTASADIRATNTRINMGGGVSTKGRFQVNDSLNRTMTATPQESPRFTVSSTKSDSQAKEPSGVTDWERCD